MRSFAETKAKLTGFNLWHAFFYVAVWCSVVQGYAREGNAPLSRSALMRTNEDSLAARVMNPDLALVAVGSGASVSRVPSTKRA
jgi:hypothetical protein